MSFLVLLLLLLIDCGELQLPLGKFYEQLRLRMCPGIAAVILAAVVDCGE